MILPQKIQINPGLIVKALYKAQGNHLYQIFIALLSLCQKHQMIILCIRAAFLLKTAPLRHIGLTADYRVYALRLTLLIEINHAIHRSMIRDGQILHSQRFRLLYDFRDLG